MRRRKEKVSSFASALLKVSDYCCSILFIILDYFSFLKMWASHGAVVGRNS